MVLTNFECWAHGGSGEGSFYANPVIERRNAPTVDHFNPNALQEYSEHSLNNPPKIVSHLSSNGYYGFAPVCRAVASNDDVKIGGHRDESIQTMDVEQQCSGNISVHIRNSPQSTEVAIGENVDKFRNGPLGRRKRIFVEDDYIQTQRRNAKKCRFDLQREEFLANSNGGYPSTYAPKATFPLSMDHDEFHVTLSPMNCFNTPGNDYSSFTAGSYNKNTLPDPVFSNPLIPSIIPNRPHMSIKTQEIKPPFDVRSNEILNTKEYENKLNNLPTNDSLQLNSKNSSLNGNVFCHDAKIDQARDDQLEKLYLFTHGGGEHHFWRHVDNSCEDI